MTSLDAGCARRSSLLLVGSAEHQGGVITRPSSASQCCNMRAGPDTRPTSIEGTDAQEQMKNNARSGSVLGDAGISQNEGISAGMG